MKRFLVFIAALLLMALSACSGTTEVFTNGENGNLISSSGVEYSQLANEGILYYFGELEFQGTVKGEEKVSQHEGVPYKTGMFAIKGDRTQNILIRYSANNEWFSIYRKSSLPVFDFSADNCVRLELVSGIGNTEEDQIHATCGDGISDPEIIAEFLSDIRSQQDPREAGLYDMITKPDGMLENCYTYAVIYGFFDEEPNLAIQMTVTSYNDLAYSVNIEGKEYVLPAQWLEKFENRKTDSKDFLAVLQDKDDDGIWGGYPIKESNCYNVTPEEVSAVSDIQIFKFSDSCASFAYVDGEVYEICASFGGYGFVNAVPWDYDEDGNIDLLIASSWGSGIHRSEISVFNAVTKESTVIFNTMELDDPDVDLIVNASLQVLSSKLPEDYPVLYGVFSAQIETGDHFADLSYTAKDLVGYIVVENGVPVFTPAE